MLLEIILTALTVAVAGAVLVAAAIDRRDRRQDARPVSTRAGNYKGPSGRAGKDDYPLRRDW